MCEGPRQKGNYKVANVVISCLGREARVISKGRAQGQAGQPGSFEELRSSEGMPGPEACFDGIVPLDAVGVRAFRKGRVMEEQALMTLPGLWTRVPRSE